MKKNICGVLSAFVVGLLLASCASVGGKPVIWETGTIERSYDVLGPVSVSEELTETNEEMIQGLAGFISKDGRVSGQLPPDMQKALDVKRLKYKERIFDKLSAKAKEYDADAVINAEYNYVPAYVTFSKNAMVMAQGTMVKYK